MLTLGSTSSAGLTGSGSMSLRSRPFTLWLPAALTDCLGCLPPGCRVPCCWIRALAPSIAAAGTPPAAGSSGIPATSPAAAAGTTPAAGGSGTPAMSPAAAAAAALSAANAAAYAAHAAGDNTAVAITPPSARRPTTFFWGWARSASVGPGGCTVNRQHWEVRNECQDAVGIALPPK